MGRKLAVLFITAFAVVALGWVVSDYLQHPQAKGRIVEEKKPEPAPKFMDFLLLGADYRPSEGGARSDTIIFARVNFDQKRIIALSIPRDSRVDIPGRGMDKINLAYAVGGPKLAMQTVSNLIGIPIQYYLLTNFNGFVDIIDTLGGVTIDVEKRMYYQDDVGTINLYPGKQKLNGQQALGYVRFRHDKLGDIGRTRRQLKFIRALGEKMLDPRSLIHLPTLVPEISKAVKTNLPREKAISLIQAAGAVKEQNILTQTLPGKFSDINGVSYWEVDPIEAKKVTQQLLQGKPTSKVIEE